MTDLVSTGRCLLNNAAASRETTFPLNASTIPVKCLLVANMYAPISGGSAVVYENICRLSPPGSMVVLAPWRHYATGEEIPGWREHDERAPYPIYRLQFLRPPIASTPASILRSAWRYITKDIPLKIQVFRAVVRIVRRERINVVCVGELVSGSWLGILSKTLLGCKMISYIHGEEITADLNFRFFRRRREYYLRRADAIVAVSGFTKRALEHQMSVAPERIELISNGVDTARFSTGPRDEEILRRLGWGGKRIILTVGRLVPRKGIDMCIRAMPRILKMMPDVRYLIVGEGGYREELEELVAQYGLQEHIKFVGRATLNDLVMYYRTCHLFVMPNREMPDGDTEGFGLVFLEANACGRAVVGGRAGGAIEAVLEAQNGLLVDGGNPHDISTKVLSLLCDDHLRAQIERRGREIAEAANVRKRAAQFHALCLRLVGQKAACS